MRIALTLLMALAVAAPAKADDDCKHTAPRQLAASVEGIRSVEIRGAAGSLVVRGGEGGALRAFGTACSSSSGDLDAIRLESRRSGDRLIVEAMMPTSSFKFGWNVQRRLDFTVELPGSLPVRIRDGSGALEVANVAAADIADGSGEIEVHGVRGMVTIVDGSGDISVVDCGGPVRITDGSGGIDIRGIRNDVVIEDDGSGEIEITNVAGNVTVENDGSGGIEIAEVTGNVLIDDDGSGSIRVRKVSGDFTVRHDGSGGVSTDEVRGVISLPKRR